MIALAYCTLGLLVGFIAGLTSSPVSATLMAALFTFVGGSGAYLIQMKPSERKLVSTAIFCFSLFCLIGLIGAVSVKVNRFLDVTDIAGTENAIYLKSEWFSSLDAINQKYTQQIISADEAYRDTWAEIQKIRTKK